MENPFLGGIKQYKSYGNLEGFPLMHCLGWCHAMTPVDWEGTKQPCPAGAAHDEQISKRWPFS